MIDDEAGAFVVNRRMHDRLERGKFGRVAKDGGSKGFAIDRIVAGRPGKAALDRDHQASAFALKRAHGGIGGGICGAWGAGGAWGADCGAGAGGGA